MVVYGGYLDKTQDGILTDTLITVTHGNKTSSMKARIEVYDEQGTKIAEQPLMNGGEPPLYNEISIGGIGWVTLGMIVNRTTKSPFGAPGGENFSFKVVTGKGDPGNTKATAVQVKRVMYYSRQEFPGEAIWNAANIKSWAETALGGKNGPGVVKHPAGWGN